MLSKPRLTTTASPPTRANETKRESRPTGHLPRSRHASRALEQWHEVHQRLKPGQRGGHEGSVERHRHDLHAQFQGRSVFALHPVGLGRVLAPEHEHGSRTLQRLRERLLEAFAISYRIAVNEDLHVGCPQQVHERQDARAVSMTVRDEHGPACHLRRTPLAGPALSTRPSPSSRQHRQRGPARPCRRYAFIADEHRLRLPGDHPGRRTLESYPPGIGHLVPRLGRAHGALGLARQLLAHVW